MKTISVKKMRERSFFSKLFETFYPVSLPLLFGIYPVLFYFRINASIVLFSSFTRILALYVGIIFVIFGLFLVVNKFKAVHAANASCVFLLFFNTYGMVFNKLIGLDIVRIEHFTLLPLFLLVAIYLSWLITKINKHISFSIWQITTLVFLGLTLFSLFKIIPIEINKNNKTNSRVDTTNLEDVANDISHPDIYYLVFDEFSGFRPMREYWHNQDVDDLKAFLEVKGFFVAEESHSSTTNSIHEMASRLNYQEYLNVSQAEKFTKIADNRVMTFAKSKGYTTVVFEELSYAYPTFPSINADYLFKAKPDNTVDKGIIFDEFGIMVADKTILQIFSKYYKLDNPRTIQHRGMILFTAAKLLDLQDIPSPKLVYTHFLLPHFPFMFDKNGGFVDPINYWNWNYYEGNYQYSIKIIKNIITGILAKADPKNPPVIILQSDHGARNKKTDSADNIILQNYPEEYKTIIMNALYLPGCDTTDLKQDINPINTFPIVFNCYFDAKIPLQ